MIRDEYPDDDVTQAVLDGRPPLVLGALAVDPVAFEEEEPESSEAAVGYGSLLSLGSSMRKKKPLIVVDPVEAENEARRVQFVAAQQLVGDDEAEGRDFLEGLAQFAELGGHESEQECAPCVEAADIPVWDDEPGYSLTTSSGAIAHSLDEDADSGAVSFAVGEASADPEVPAGLDVPADLELSVDPAEPLGEAPDREMAISVEALARIYEARETAPIGPVGETDPPQDLPVVLQAEIRPHGHSLRARMPSRPARKTLAAQVWAFLGWLYGGLARRPG